MPDILKNINSPNDVKSLTPEQKSILCEQLRSEIISTVSENGGHLASNLGVVELSVALMSVYDLPSDNIIWDVGHQCYCHKLLTGRANQFSTIRKQNGLSGFPDKDESKYDTFTTGHSSASVSSAFGLACANQINNENSNTVVVIGDGSLSGGLSFEGLNNVGRFKKNFVVIINDNKMSISKNVGSLAKHFSFLRVNSGYINAKNKFEKALLASPILGKPLAFVFKKIKSFIKKAFYNPTLFETMGFSYYGPYDGHNLDDLIEVLQNAKKINKPIVIHIKTTKGKGYEHAEYNPKDFHGVPSFDPISGQFQLSRNSFSAVFGNCLSNIASVNEKVCAVTAAMSAGTALSVFSENYKDRFFDVGIAEAHAVTFCSGLAKKGLIPVFAVYSTFLQRAYDSIIHDVALQDLKVILAVDRAGFVGDDGKTHQGLFDVSFLKTIPNITVFSPSFFDELDFTLQRIVAMDYKTCAIRYPRGHEGYKPKSFITSEKDFDLYSDTSAETCIVCYGRVFSHVAEAVDSLDLKIKVIKLNKIVPFSREAIEIAMLSKKVLFVEEAYCGIADNFISEMLQLGFKGKAKKIDIPNPFVSHASVEKQYEMSGLDKDSILEELKFF